MQELANPMDDVFWTDKEHCDLQVIEGLHHPDGWINRECEFLLRTERVPASLRLEFWNPDFALKYRDNRLNLTIQGDAFMSPSLYLGEAFAFEMDFQPDQQKSLRVRVRSDVFCQRGELDKRERGVVLKSGILTFRD